MYLPCLDSVWKKHLILNFDKCRIYALIPNVVTIGSTCKTSADVEGK